MAEAKRWKCDYCGTVNAYESLKCTGCYASQKLEEATVAKNMPQNMPQGAPQGGVPHVGAVNVAKVIPPPMVQRAGLPNPMVEKPHVAALPPQIDPFRVQKKADPHKIAAVLLLATGGLTTAFFVLMLVTMAEAIVLVIAPGCLLPLVTGIQCLRGKGKILSIVTTGLWGLMILFYCIGASGQPGGVDGGALMVGVMPFVPCLVATILCWK